MRIAKGGKKMPIKWEWLFEDPLPFRRVFYGYPDGVLRVVPIIQGGTNPVFNQNGFRFYQNTGSWTGLENENDNHTIADDTTILIRLELEVTNAKVVNNYIPVIRANKNGTGYADLTTARADGLRIATDGFFTDAAADNNDRLTSSSLTFTGGELDEDGVLGEVAGGMDFVGQDHWEIAIAIEIDEANASANDWWDIQLYKDDGTTPLDGYTRTPRLTYSPSAPVNVDVPVASLEITTYVPTVATPVNVEVPVAALQITTYVPTAAVTDNINIEVPVASVQATTYAPTVATTNLVNVTVPVATLQVTTYTPTVVDQTFINVEVPVANLQVTTYAPTAATTAHVDVEVPLATFTSYDLCSNGRRSDLYQRRSACCSFTSYDLCSNGRNSG
jgi:hypothetical protein